VRSNGPSEELFEEHELVNSFTGNKLDLPDSHGGEFSGLFVGYEWLNQSRVEY